MFDRCHMIAVVQFMCLPTTQLFHFVTRLAVSKLSSDNIYVYTATECMVLGASLVPLSTPLALFYIGFPFGGLPNRGASLVPLSTPSFCLQIGEPHWYHLVLPARLGRFCPLGIEVEKQGFRTACLITGQKFQGVGLKLTAFILTFRDPSSHLCQKTHESG